MKILAALILACSFSLPAFAGDASVTSVNRVDSYRLSNGDTIYWVTDRYGVHKTVIPKVKTAAEIIKESKLKAQIAKQQGKKVLVDRYVPWTAAQGGLNYGSKERRGSSSFENSPYRYFYGTPR